MKSLAFVALSTVCLAGCAPPAEPYVMVTPYSDADFEAWSGTGPASLHGQAFLKTVGGDVKLCAGNAVNLSPKNAYNEEWINSVHTGSLAVPDDRALSHNRHTTCDAEGRFVFTALPLGDWIVTTTVTWGVPTIDPIFHQPEVDQQGGLLMQHASLVPGDNSVILSDGDILRK